MTTYETLIQITLANVIPAAQLRLHFVMSITISLHKTSKLVKK